MAILIDINGHLVSDTSLEELHAFARRIGLRASWFQHRGRIPHYDLTSWRMRRRAMRAGAEKVSARELARRAFRP